MTLNNYRCTTEAQLKHNYEKSKFFKYGIYNFREEYR
jgi:hypothetical protein